MNVTMKDRALAGVRVLAFGAVLFSGVVGVFQTSPVQAATPLFNYNPPLLVDSTNKGDVWICYDRPKRPEGLLWGGKEYMFLDAGTDLQIWNPYSGALVAKGHFSIGSGCSGPVTEGTLFSESPEAPLGNDGFEEVNICDECRFGVANTAEGLLVFDLGTPSPSGDPMLTEIQLLANTETGGTYKIGSTQYVLVEGGYGSPFYGDCPTGQMGLYTFTSTGDISGPPVCIADTLTFLPKQGRQFKVKSVSGVVEDFFIYRQAANHDVYIVKLASNGMPILPPINSTPFNAGNFDFFTLDTYDLADDTKPPAGPRGYLVITNAAAAPYATVYELTPSANGSLNISTLWTNQESITWDIAGMRYPYLFLNVLGNPVQPRRLLDLSTNPPTFIDFDYWNDPEGDEDYNTAGATPGKAIDQDAYFSPDGQWMYFARFYQMSRFKFTPSNPTAVISVTPSPAFWDDPVVVDGSASAGAAEYAIWIDDDPSGTNTGATVVAGTAAWNVSANPWSASTSLSWTIPSGATGPYYAHVAVQDTSRGYPYDPIGDPGMLANQMINLDTTPQPRITISGDEGPFTVFLDDTAILSASTSDGNPTSYLWNVTSPTNVQYTGTTQTASQTFDEQGVWNVSLTVEWADGTYSDTATTTVDVKSALADFTFSPASPKDDEDINLDASASKPLGQLSYSWEVLDTSNSVVWSGTGMTATIPADTLVPNSYTVRLTVANTSTRESDTLEKPMAVTSGASQLAITPENPEIGQAVSFTVQGIDGITGVYWYFGGASCDGSPSEQNCTSGIWCERAGYTYKFAGTYSVRADVSTDTGTTTLYGTVTVQNSGTCPTTGCTYSSAITGTNFPSSGGSGTVTISASSTSCTWTASSSQTWLSLSSTSGSGSENISFSVASNPGGTRSATITLRGGSTFVKTYTISQSGTGGGSGSLSISPTNPQKGEAVTFAVQGFTGIQSITWDFGGQSCDGSPSEQTCNSGIYCTPTTYTYSEAGTYSVSATVTSDSGTQTVSGTVTVQNSGECSGGTCSYTLSSNTTSFGSNGGTGSVNVSTDPDCSWSATSTQPTWLHVNASSTGSGSFSFTVDPFTGSDSRTGQIIVGNRSVTITQNATATAGDLLVSVAVNAPGEKGTYWQTDLCVFNPNTGRSASVELLFLQTGSPPVKLYDLTVPILGTVCFPDVLQAHVGTVGALKVQVNNADQLDAPVVATSRTYTGQGDEGVGTYGQNVPVFPISSVPATRLVIGGLQHYENGDGSGFRTNIGLVNPTSGDVGGIVIHLYSKNGQDLGTLELGLPANGFVQVDRIVEKILGTGSSLEDFSVVIRFKDASGSEGAAKEITAYASMVDNVTGDAVFVQATPLF